MKLTRQKFEEVVARAMDDLPEEIADALSNVFVVVEQWPSNETIEKMNLRNRYELLALYEGVPLTKRTTGYNALPDRVTIFQGPIEAVSRTEAELKRQIKVAVVHEIAHHFGIGDKRLRELGY
jgi:predicted Zn-dependent protease with MMP-like domain